MATVSSAASNTPLNVSGLASGLDTNSIISALLAAERQPIALLGNQKTTLEGQQTALKSIQSNLTQLSFVASELGSPILFHTSQGVGSSNSAQVTASVGAGAAVGGYEVEVLHLANSAQRTFTFKAPSEASTITIDGEEIGVSAGMSLKALVNRINTDSKASVYAAAPNGETLILSSRTTGAAAPGFIAVSNEGESETLTEQAGLAKAGRDAEYSVDGVLGSSSTNVLTNAIPGVTLNLKAVTTKTGPVTITVEPPAPSKAAIVNEVQLFVNLYNSTIAEVNAQLRTTPPASALNREELQTGTLFGDMQFEGLLGSMRRNMYEPQSGLPAGMASLTNIGISTGAASAKGTESQGSLEGQLTVNAAALEQAIETNPEGVQQLLAKWSAGFHKLLTNEALPGGTIDARIQGDGGQISQLSKRIATMNEMITLHQQMLTQRFAAMEALVSQNKSTSSFLSAHLASLEGKSSTG